MNSTEIASVTKVPENYVEEVLNFAMDNAEKISRNPQPASQGGISQSAASRKYNIPQRTISRWVERGEVLIIESENKREVYADERSLNKQVSKYQKDPGQGKRTAKPPED